MNTTQLQQARKEIPQFHKATRDHKNCMDCHIPILSGDYYYSQYNAIGANSFEYERYCLNCTIKRELIEVDN